MTNWVKSALFAGTLMVAGIASIIGVSAQEKMPAANWLFVQAADSATVDGSKLVLKGVAPQTIMFADRPDRMTGDVATTSFVKLWTDGKDSFQKDPPNATLSVTGADGKSQVSVLELTDPVLSGDTLTYTIKVLSDAKPVSGQTASLFIDWWYAGPGHCWRGPYGGLHCGW
ncbi:hypothetical protein [Aquabacter spiritensis]|uniref:Uncharacterized protein n=1 Tax=Aquabacter spiritensis TaxID=933073 RepID=A0A4V2UYI8_9HYPH|nr:hypothetical protein [Aquabacter spiritensis]TCT07568.1 hypothetical protein EDC64_10186 [Aquabacter spiritensis]